MYWAVLTSVLYFIFMKVIDYMGFYPILLLATN